MSNIPKKYADIVQAWKETPLDCAEDMLSIFVIAHIYRVLKLGPNQVEKSGLGKGTGLIPDGLIYADENRDKAPVIVAEYKKRIPELATADEATFMQLCLQEKSLYREALGYRDNNPKNNGIRQYLDNSNEKIEKNRLAYYGLVFNGDFFQIWRRVDGLILPLTPLQRMTEETIPLLIQQLEHCLKSPRKGLVVSNWNRKGGVGKTTNTINVGAALALEKKKVLLIDWDTQNDLARNLLPSWEAKEQKEDFWSKCLDKLYNKLDSEAKEILKENTENLEFCLEGNKKRTFSLDVLSAEEKWLNLFQANDSLTEKRKVEFMQKAIHLLAFDYDYIFIDTSPNSDIWTRSMLFCIDALLIPADLSIKALHHAVEVHDITIKEVREGKKINKNLYFSPWNLGVAYSNCAEELKPNSQLEKIISKQLKKQEFQGYICQTNLKVYNQAKVAEAEHLPVICWEKSKSASLFQELAKEVFLSHHFITN
ncbi:MAG: AAA family ATPase [Okeania sp. SIO2H7]|nr:AAA family ATPase [Okeania sp. SIO2H7]